MKKKVQWDEMDMAVEYQGKAITLPDDPGRMPIREAITALERKWEDEEREVSVYEWIENAHPLDSAVAFVKALKNLFGFASCVSSPGFFGPNPPQYMTVKTGFRRGEEIQVPIGNFRLPGVENSVTTAIEYHDTRHEFLIYGEFKNKEKKLLSDLANETRRIVAAESIYKGKAVSVRVEKGCQLNQSNPPTFLDVTDTTESSVLFDSDTEHQIRTNILTPIKRTEEVRKHHIPLGRGILLEGPFGTGKSLTARVTAHVCEENGWTFVLVDRVQGLKEALHFANRYAPSVVFAEDIDRVLDKRDEAANDLINTINGVGNNRKEVMIILTTNFVEKIDPVILRPGRLDAVISLRPPNASTVEKLLRFYGQELVKAESDLTEASVELSGQIPAVIREAIERAKLSMIDRGDELVTGEDIVIAAKTMKAHLSLLQPKAEEKSAGDKLLGILNRTLANGVEERLEAFLEEHWGEREQKRMLQEH